MDRRDVAILVVGILLIIGLGVSRPIMDAFGEIPETTEEVTTYETEEESAAEPEVVELIIEQTEIEEVVLEDNEEEVVETPQLNEEIEDPEEAIEEVVEVEANTEEEVPEVAKTYYGSCTITHYCNCSVCCGQWAGGATASGVMPQAGVTVACGDLPFGTEIEINGERYIVQDRGVPGRWIDIYCSSHEEALQRGMYTADVYIIN